MVVDFGAFRNDEIYSAFLFSFTVTSNCRFVDLLLLVFFCFVFNEFLIVTVCTVKMFLFVFLLFVSSALFSVMCYNVLCDKYATRQLYGYCPTWALNWEYRKKSIMQEIMGCNADIISLQVRDVIVSFTGS